MSDLQSTTQRTWQRVWLLMAIAAVVAGCGTGRAFSRGQQAGATGDWEAAVGFYRQALQDNPSQPDYKISLERAMLAAAQMYTDRARQFEAADALEDAIRAYRKALEFEPGSRSIAQRAAELERTVRMRLEAAAPRPEIDKLRAEAARRSAEPVLNPSSRDPLSIHFSNAGLRDILSFIGDATGINVTYDREFQDRNITLDLEGVTLEQALQQIMVANQLFYRVLSERTLVVAADTAQKRTQYEEQVIRTFFVSNADATELTAILTGIVRVGGQAIAPTFVANKTSNTITVRATAAALQVVERVIQANDKPRAEVIVDVQILEVNRERAKQYGLNLSDYTIGGVFSPEVNPGGGSTSAGTGSGGTGTTSSSSASAGLFNMNTVSNGVSAADFYLSVPSAVMRFLESDSSTKTLAKPQLRGTEGQKLELNLGEEVPVPSTTFQPLAGGGAASQPLTSFAYKTVGVVVKMTPRVTYEGEILLELEVESSARGQDTNIAGQNLPSFLTRKVNAKLRLRDGESNLLAGLLREDERRSLRGFPGVLRLPIVRQLFSGNDQSIRQSDVVMLLTPRIIRTHELTASDLSPIYIGTQNNMAVGGPPPAIMGGGATPVASAAGPGVAAAQQTPRPLPPGTLPAVVPAGSEGVIPMMPVGTSAVPGTVGVVAPPAAPPASGVVVFQPLPADTGAPADPAPVPVPASAPVATTLMTPPVTGAGGISPFAPAAIVDAPAARLVITPPSEMRVGSGPYTVPVSISGAAQLTGMTLTISYNPAILRVRSVSEGTLMRQGNVTPTFTQQVDAAAGRIDIAIVRAGDAIGVTASGLIAAVLFEPVTTGTSTLTVTGSATRVGDGSAILTGTPAGVVIR
ncbi:MAG: hypothetical protein FJW29_04975 [Acidobacteria bacterium]|nr:hypothetical protein [Acidobacteriota bacterium]